MRIRIRPFVPALAVACLVAATSGNSTAGAVRAPREAAAAARSQEATRSAQDAAQAAQAPAAEQRRSGPTVSAEKFNYKPGETALIKGAGFMPGELVTLRVAHANGQDDGEAHLAFSTFSDAEGRIADQWIVPPTESSNRVFTLTAEGQASGLSAFSSFNAAPIYVIDDAGADDYPGQKDLNFLTFDYGTPGSPSIALTWGWDDTAWSGNNSGDACVLFDTDADGKANYAFCVTVKGNPVTLFSTRLYSCGDTRSDRCSQNVPITQFDSDATVAGGADPFGSLAAHITGNTCGAKPGCYTADTVATVTAVLDDFGGAASARLLNVCSYPSAEPNSAPSECVITPNNGFLTITKVAPDSTQFTFNIGTGQQSQDGTTSWNITGSASESFISFAPGTTYDLTEAVPAGYSLSGASCAVQTTQPTPTGTFDAPTWTVNNFAIQSGLETICTFTNTLLPGTLVVTKEVVNNNGGTKKATNFTFEVNGGTATSFLQDGLNELAGKNTITVQPGTYSVAEPAVAGYDTTYTGCSNIPIAAGGTATCAIKNDDQAATLIVQKLVVNNNGGAGKATDFAFKVNGGTATSFVQDGADPLKGKNTLTVDAGTYNVTETPPSGYTVTANTCVDVVIANGGTATCTITNTDSKATPGGSTVQTARLYDSITITGIRPGAEDADDATAIFRLYSDAGCNTQVGDSETRPVTLAGTASTVIGVLVTLNNTYRWTVEYSGDAFNTGFTTGCGDETTAVTFAYPQQ